VVKNLQNRIQIASQRNSVVYRGRRDISLSTNATQTSGGVIVANVTRHADPISAYQKRLALADHSAASAQSDFQATLEQLIGSVDEICPKVGDDLGQAAV
jgi:hypothetical protein